MCVWKCRAPTKFKMCWCFHLTTEFLLWSIHTRMKRHHSFFTKTIKERKFRRIVKMNMLYFDPILVLNQRKEGRKDYYHFGFCMQKTNPCKTSTIINYYQEISIAFNSGNMKGVPNVIVNELKRCCG